MLPRTDTLFLPAKDVIAPPAKRNLYLFSAPDLPPFPYSFFLVFTSKISNFPRAFAAPSHRRPPPHSLPPPSPLPTVVQNLSWYDFISNSLQISGCIKILLCILNELIKYTNFFQCIQISGLVLVALFFFYFEIFFKVHNAQIFELVGFLFGIKMCFFFFLFFLKHVIELALKAVPIFRVIG